MNLFERTAPARAFPVKLSLDEANRIVAARSETIIGWMGEAREGAAQPLTVPGSLLAPSPTSSIVYACNLPALPESGATVLDMSGRLPNKIGRDLEDVFLASSFPGGQAAITGVSGEPLTVRFRWVCLTSNVSIGAVWRCFVCVSAYARRASWWAIEHDYIFESGGGTVLNPPGDLMLPCPANAKPSLKLIHPDGMVTSFPCNSGRVKVTRLSPDGWAKRDVISLMLHADNRIVALFSDGRRETIATAAAANRLVRAA